MHKLTMFALLKVHILERRAQKKEGHPHGAALSSLGDIRLDDVVVDAASVGVDLHIYAVHGGPLAHNNGVLCLDCGSTIAAVDG